MTKRIPYISTTTKAIVKHSLYSSCGIVFPWHMFQHELEYDVQALIIDSVMSKYASLKGDPSRAETLPLLVRKEVVFLDTASRPLVEDTQLELDSISSLYVDG